MSATTSALIVLGMIVGMFAAAGLVVLISRQSARKRAAGGFDTQKANKRQRKQAKSLQGMPTASSEVAPSKAPWAPPPPQGAPVAAPVAAPPPPQGAPVAAPPPPQGAPVAAPPPPQGAPVAAPRPPAPPPFIVPADSSGDGW